MIDNTQNILAAVDPEGIDESTALDATNELGATAEVASPDQLNTLLAAYQKNQNLLKTLSPSKVYKIRQLLLAGEDPLLLGIYHRAPFASVARIANSILRERSQQDGVERGQIPENLGAYLQLVVALAKAQLALEDKKAAEGQEPAREAPGA